MDFVSYYTAFHILKAFQALFLRKKTEVYFDYADTCKD